MSHGKLYITTALFFTISLSCCTCLSKDNAPKNDMHKPVRPLPEKPLPPIPLPPGSADIEAWMQDYWHEGDSFLCKVKISQVNAYGAATPPLPQGYVFILEVPGALLEKNKYEEGKIFVRGKLLKISVRHLSTNSGNGSADRWTATAFTDLAQ